MLYPLSYERRRLDSLRHSIPVSCPTGVSAGLTAPRCSTFRGGHGGARPGHLTSLFRGPSSRRRPRCRPHAGERVGKAQDRLLPGVVRGHCGHAHDDRRGDRGQNSPRWRAVPAGLIVGAEFMIIGPKTTPTVGLAPLIMESGASLLIKPASYPDACWEPSSGSGWKRYPMPGSVSSQRGCDGSGSSLRRSWAM
jgi:hypothetical protein